MLAKTAIRAAVMAACFVCCTAVVHAQRPGCIITGANPTQLRSGGIAEKAGEVVIECMGGTPTAAGLPVPTASLTLTFNTAVTSRVLAPGWSEALLLIDEPQPRQQRACGTPGDTISHMGDCVITGTFDPTTVYDGSAGRPNVFPGMVAGPNSLIWPNVPLDPSGQSDARILRFVNLRLGAAAFGPMSLNQPPIAVTATLTGALPVTLLNSATQIIGQVQAGFLSSAETPAQCAPEAATLAGLLGPQLSQVDLLANKGFAAAFKPRTPLFIDDNTSPPPVNQDIPGNIYLSETGFFNSAFPTLTGRGNLAQAGLANQGTRIAVRVSDVPAGATLYSPVVLQSSTDSSGSCNVPGVARRVETNVNGSNPFATTPGDAAGVAPLAELVLTCVN